MKAARWPAIAVIVALLAAALLFDRDVVTTPRAPAQAPALGASVAPVDAQSALWFCNGGTAAATGLADHRVVIINTTDASRAATLTAFGSKPATGPRPQPVAREFTLAPYGRVDVRLADVIGQVPFASATVEVAGGGVLVEHRVVGASGTDAGPCASAASSSWYVPIGATDTEESPTGTPPKAREFLVFFNPFPGDAVIDAAFSTDVGFRGTPAVFKGLVVPGGSVVGLDLAVAGLAVTSEIAAAITTRSGRIVVDRLQLFADGTTRRGLALSTGVATPAPAWVFPVGALTPGREERVVVYNPNATPSEVDVEVRPQDRALAVEPFQLTVRPGQHSQIDLRAEGRLAALISAGSPYWLVVRSADGSSIVAERLAVVAAAADVRGGVALSSGSAVASTRSYADIANAEPAGSSLVVVNPSPRTIAQVRLTVIAGGTATVNAKYRAIELGSGDRLQIPLSELGTGVFTVVIDASAPVVVERELLDATDRTIAGALPDASAVSLVELGAVLSLGG